MFNKGDDRLNTEVNERIYYEISQFLIHEAELLDTGEFRAWYDLLADDLLYQVPVRVTLETGQGPGLINNMYHIDDDRHSLGLRIKRLETEYAWSERPPSRIRRFVTNIRVKPGHGEQEFQVKSNLLLYRGRGDSPDYEMLTGERQDVVRLENGNWRLGKRTVLLDQTTLPTRNLSFFL